MYNRRSFEADELRETERGEKLRRILAEVNGFDEESETEDVGFDEQEWHARSKRINDLRGQMPDLHADLAQLTRERNTRER